MRSSSFFPFSLSLFFYFLGLFLEFCPCVEESGSHREQQHGDDGLLLPFPAGFSLEFPCAAAAAAAAKNLWCEEFWILSSH